MPTNQEFLDGLAAYVPPIQGPIPYRLAVAPLIHVLQQAMPGGSTSAPTKGLIIHTPATTIQGITIHSVSAELLGFLDYPTEASYAAAVVGDGGDPFVHVADQEVTTAHLQGSSETYDARLRRYGGAYRRMRLQGVTVSLSGVQTSMPSTGDLRFTLIWPVPT